MNTIIAGASKGIGKAIALKFAAAGHALFLCARSEPDLNNTAEEIRIAYPGIAVNIFTADLSVKSDVESFANRCLQACTPQILVNNAGTFIPGNISDEPGGRLGTMMNTNLYSAYHLTRKLLPAMMSAKRGHIFNICSIASLDAYPNGGAYSISKFAMNGFNKNLRQELKTHGIKVTGVFPGATLTDSWGNFDNSNHRIMEAKDIADMIYVASELSEQAVVDDIIITPQLGPLN